MTPRATRRMLLFLVAAIFAVITLFPIYWMVLSSLLPTSVILAPTPPIIPPIDRFSLAGYANALELKPVARWLVNSLLVMAGAIVISLAVSVLGGYSLSRLASRAQVIVGYGVFTAQTLPQTLLVIPFYLIASQLGLIDNLFSLMLADAIAIIPFATWMMKNYFDTIPRELEDAALVDGCTPLGALVRISLPLAKPGAAAAAVYAGVLAWGDYLFARTLVLDSSNWTITVGASSFISQFTVNWDSLMAVGVLSMAPMVILFLVFEPLLTSGLSGWSR